MRGFKKTVQNQKYEGVVIKVWSILTELLHKRTTIGTNDTVLMTELLPNENGFERKNSQMLKFYQFPKLP